MMRCIQCGDEVKWPTTEYRWECECGFKFSTPAKGLLAYRFWKKGHDPAWKEVPDGCLLVVAWNSEL